jgi:hypothetical protein
MKEERSAGVESQPARPVLEKVEREETLHERLFIMSVSWISNL